MFDTSSPTRPTFQHLVVLLLAVLLGVAAVVVAAPAADSQTTPVYASDFPVQKTSGCPAGSTHIGSATGFRICRPDGFVPIRDFGQCLASGMAFWSHTGAICSNFISRPLTETCPGWQFPVYDAVIPQDGFIVFENTFACARPLLISTASSATQHHLVRTPVCIEDDVVQASAPAAQEGSIFTTDGVNYVIHAGAPTCSFNCMDGFDVNCDGKIGDFCPVEIDRSTVAGVAECLRASDALVAVVDTVASVPALDSAPPIPIGPQLAHSGSESAALAYVGTGLIAFGALALGTRRRIDRD